MGSWSHSLSRAAIQGQGGLEEIPITATGQFLSWWFAPNTCDLPSDEKTSLGCLCYMEVCRRWRRTGEEAFALGPVQSGANDLME